MKYRMMVTLMSALVLIGAAAEANLYYWVDENGVRHYSNEPPPENVNVLERMSEVPHSPEADRQRMEEYQEWRQNQLRRIENALEEQRAEEAARAERDRRIEAEREAAEEQAREEAEREEAMAQDDTDDNTIFVNPGASPLGIQQ